MFKLRPSRPLIIAALPALCFIIFTFITTILQSDKTIILPQPGISVVYPNRISWDYVYRERDDAHILYQRRPWFNFWSDRSNQWIEISTENCVSGKCTARGLLDAHVNTWPKQGEENPGRSLWLYNLEYFDAQPIGNCKVEAAYFFLGAPGMGIPSNAVLLECDEGSLMVMGYGFRSSRSEIIKVTTELANSIRWLD